MTTQKTTSFKWLSFLFWVGITLGLGFLGGIIGSADGYEALNAPPLAPPGIVFPIVWTVLYILMGSAAYLIRNSGDLGANTALKIYLAQLVVNVLWPILFFRFEWRLFSFFWIVLLLALVLFMLLAFYAIDKRAAYLNIPYVLWLLFAAYLNLGFYILN